MKRSDIASIIGFSFVVIAVALFWSINWIFGLGFTLFVGTIVIWYIRTKKRGIPTFGRWLGD